MDEQYDEPFPDAPEPKVGQDELPGYDLSDETSDQPQQATQEPVEQSPLGRPVNGEPAKDWFDLPPQKVEAVEKVAPVKKNDDWFDLPEPKEQQVNPEAPSEPINLDFSMRDKSSPESPRRSSKEVRAELASIDETVNAPASLYDKVNRTIFGIPGNDELKARKEQLLKELPDIDARETANRERFLPQLKEAEKKAESEGPESLPYWILRKGASWPHAMASAIVYGLSKEAINKAGPDETPSESDFRNVALYEKQQREAQQEGFGAKLGGDIIGLPGTLVGFEIGSLGAGAAGATGGTSLLGRMGGTAATFASSPNVTALPAIQENVAEGRSPFDPRGLPGPALRAGISGATFGAAGYGLSAAGEYIAKAAGIPGAALMPKSVADKVVGDLVTSGIEFPVAQQVADLINYGSGLSKEYGVVGEIAEGKYPEALKSLASQALLGMAFRGVEALGRSGVPKDEAIKTVERGWDAEQARSEQKPASGDIREEPPKVADVSGRNEATAAADVGKAETPPTDTSRADEISARAKVDAANPEGAIPFEIADVLDKVPLTAQERRVFELRHGQDGLTQEAVGAHKDVMGERQTPYTRERIRQIEAKAIKKIAEHLNAELGITDKPISVNEYKARLKEQLARDLSGPDRLADAPSEPGRRNNAFVEQEKLERAHDKATDDLIAELEKARNEIANRQPDATANAENPQGVQAPEADAASPAGPPRQARPAIVEAATGIKNATVDKELEAMGLPKAEHGERTNFASEWEKAKETAKADPAAGRRLLNDLAAKNRAIGPEEKALVAHELNRRINERDSAQEQLNKATSEEDKATARVRVAAAKDEYKQAADIITKSATISGQSLAFQRMMFNRDFSLAQMERDFKEAKGEKYSEADQKHVEEQNNKIADLQKQLDDYESKVKEPSERLTKARQEVDKAWKEFAAVARGEQLFDIGAVAAAAGKLAVAYSKLAGAHLAGFLEEGKKFGAMTPQVEKILTDAWMQAQARDTTEVKSRGPTTEESRLKAYKTRTQGRIDELTGVKEPKEKRTPLVLDKEAQQLKANLERAKQEWNSKLDEQERANRTPLEKAQDTFLRWRRGFILSSPTVLSKLGSAAATRFGLTPIEEAVGAGIGKMIPRVAKRAPTEGGINVKAEARALAEGFTTGMKDAWETLKTGKSQLDVLYGKKEGPPPGLIDMIGHLHGAMKAPVKRAAYTRALEKGFEWAIKEGLDPHDPAVQTRVGVEAYKAGESAIFMQDNIVSNAWRSAMNRLERPDPATGKASSTGKALSTVGQAMLPIVKVPTNIVSEAFTNAFGAVTGSARLANAYRKGIDNLAPDQADLIMRQLKKGSLGLAVLALGYFNSDKVGGFYQPNEKRRKGELQPGESKVFGMTVPSYVQHSPLGMVYQLGGTIGRLAGKDGMTLASANALLGLLEETPFVREAVDIAKAREHPEQFAGQQAKSFIIPAAVQWVARNLDRDANGQVKRKTKGVVQELQSGLPYFRQKLPER